MNCAVNPPPVLSMARVLAYAIVDDSIGFSGHQRLYVDGKLLGKVPRLALCQPLSKNPITDILVFYCNDEWDVLGVTNAESFDAAQREVERYYPGVTHKWIKREITKSEAVEWIKTHHKDTICSFCGRLPFEVETSISHGPAVICNICIDEFYEALHQQLKK